jgi:hypothetical protein
VFRGGPGRDELQTSSGDDQFYGGPDYDVFRLKDDFSRPTGLGNSVMYGQGGTDLFWFSDNAIDSDSCGLAPVTIRLFGNEGNDHFHFHTLRSFTGGQSCFDLVIKGGVGEGDRFYSHVNANTMIDLGRGIAKARYWAWSDRLLLTSIENASGGPRNDIIIGNEAANLLHGVRGRDEIHGNGGSDTLLGWKDRDRIYGGKGDDVLDGGRSRDQLYGDDGDDWLRGWLDDDYLDGGDGTDTLDGGPDHDECTRGEFYESCEVIQ